MKKIIYVCSTLKRTGPTNQLYNIVSNLDLSVFQPVIITLSPEPKNSLESKFVADNICIIKIGLSRISGFFLLKRQLYKLLNNIQPDLIHSQGVRADYLISQYKSKAYSVSTLRNFPQFDYKMTYGKFFGSLMFSLHIRALNKFDYCSGVSKSVADNLHTLSKSINICVIENGVDTNVYYPLSSLDKEKLRESLNLPADSVIWISTGHLSDRKNPINILESFSDFLKYNKNHVLVFLGDGPLDYKCRTKYKSENILFLGSVSNVAEYLQSADYYVSSSIAEGLPNSVLEAMACSLPILLSDIEPHKEIFNLDNKIGSLFKCNELFIDQIMDIQLKKYKELSVASLNVINNCLSASIMSNKYQKLYLELLG